MHYACLHGYTDCAKLYLEAGIDINVQNYEKKTALEYAKIRGFQETANLIENWEQSPKNNPIVITDDGSENNKENEP